MILYKTPGTGNFYVQQLDYKVFKYFVVPKSNDMDVMELPLMGK